ncbi:hypothetical protein [Actibacterium sp. 188UL27-1]|uniref:hypothetical protein n=1 Tax=Actibacterium sp. 188UL27-1 TaxID=2786961 RepID=UPI00195C9458|nr:hypothetical protein [Actibacterium sp. 188UL27-1]MBM7068337.1 hypothetical protein [Actibacterium sp. 188UL27-1]
MKTYFAAALIAATACAGVAQADLAVRFVEGAPKDRFVLENTGCPLGPAIVTLDLTSSAGGLIFDITASGAGVEVFQPVEIQQGADALIGMTVVGDGDQILQLSLAGLAVGQSVTLTTDLDDTAPQSALGQIRVAGTEIAGSAVRVSTAGTPNGTGSFDETAQAIVPLAVCES